MINLKVHYLNFEANEELFRILREQRFKKTEMDIVYDDFVRWEKNGLLWRDYRDKDSQREYSYVDYTWAKLVAQLRQFGFDYGIIRTFKCSLSETLDNDFYRFMIEEKRELILERYSQEELDEFMESLEKGNDEDEPVTAFEAQILNVVNHNDAVSLLFFNDTPHFYVPVSGEVLREFEQRPEASEYFGYLKKSHVSISINEITKSFIKNDLSPKDRSEKFTSILSEQEHNALKLIRKNYRKLKEIKIVTKNTELDRIELTTTKKARAESMIIEHFKKGDYKSISIEAVDGKVVHIGDTKKHKL